MLPTLDHLDLYSQLSETKDKLTRYHEPTIRERERRMRALEGETLQFSGLEPGKDIFQLDVPINPDGSQYIHTVTCGQTNKKNLLLVHGYGGTNLMFVKNYKELSEKYHVYGIDLPGMGLSSRDSLGNPNNEQIIDYFVDAIERWREQVDIDSMEIMGHSFGGYVSGLYSVKYKERVSRLVLLSPAGITKREVEDSLSIGFLKGDGVVSKLQKAVHKYLWGKKLDPFTALRGTSIFMNMVLRHNVKERIGRVANEEEQKVTVELYKELALMPTGSEKFIFSLFHHSLTAHRPLEEEFLNMLTIPILFLYGDEDWMDMVGAERLKKNYAAGCDVIIVEKALHELTLSNPAEVSRLVLSDLPVKEPSHLSKTDDKGEYSQDQC